MYFSEITLESKAEFDHYIGQHGVLTSEMTFTNFFAWRYFYRFRYAVIAGLLCVVSVPCRGDHFAMMPIGDVNEENFAEAFSKLRQYFIEQGWQPVFKKIPGHMLDFFKDKVSSEEAIVFDRDNSDYLYNTFDLIELRGKRYDGKRNHINRFKKRHTYEYVPLECSFISECSRIMEEWCEEKDCDCQEGEYCEREANLELLRNFKTLGCKGALIKVDGAFEAFTVGEMLNEDTAVIHIEKAKNSIDGLYTLINQQFAQREWGGTRYINREQDLGLEGMRRSKLSYQPIQLVEKYTVYAD